VGYNTDNRLMSNVMPSTELHAVVEAHGLSIDEIERLATNAMMSSFAPMELRRRVVAEQIAPAHR
jgi:adenosine deaminase